jgi:hypothetical protein
MRPGIAHKVTVAAIVLFLLPLFCSSFPQETKVNQRKIDREHKKKEKAKQKEYEEAKKMHVKNQSKETRAMMKKARKDSKKNTPMKPPGSKKCK